MNIQKSELMILDKIRFRAGENAPQAPVPETVETEQSAEKGMKALSFMSAKNLMSNPELAQSVSANNAPSFKAKANVAKTAAFLGVAALMSAFTSCMKQEQDANIDMTMLSDIQALLQKLVDQNDANKDMWSSMLNYIMRIAYNTEDDAEFKANIISYMENDAKLQEAILAQSQKTGQDVKEIKNAINDLITQYTLNQIDLMDLINGIKDIVGNIDSTLNLFYQQFIKAEERKAEHEKNVEISLKNLEKYGKATTEDVAAIKADQDSIIVLNNTQIAQLDELIKLNKQNNKISEETKRILLMNGFTEAYIAQLVSKGVAGVNEANGILREIADNTKASNEKLDAVNVKLDAIYDELRHGNISEAEAAKKIIALLQSIDGKLDKIFNRLGNIENKIDKYGKEARQFYYQNHKDAKALIRASYLNLRENKKQTDRLDSLIVLDNQKDHIADSIIINLQADIKDGTNKVVEAIKNHNIDMKAAFNYSNNIQNANAKELLEFLKTWKKEDHADHINIYNGEKTIIALIEKYGPLIGGNSNEGIIDAINLFMNQEKAADEAKAKQQEVDVDALLKAINNVKTEVSALGVKADAILSKMDTQISLLSSYGDKVVARLDENNALLKALKFETPDLAVLTNYVKELRDNSKTANTYLDVISKKQISIGEQIANLEALAGKQLTADELEVLWKQHDADNWAEAKAYFNAMGIDLKQFLQGLHDEDMEKADEAIELLKKGNKIAQDTYELVAAWAERAKNQPNYSEILKKIYDYLPNLICNCKCGEDVNKNEGIKGEIDDLING